jgi:hypothetical protein
MTCELFDPHDKGLEHRESLTFLLEVIGPDISHSTACENTRVAMTSNQHGTHGTLKIGVDNLKWFEFVIGCGRFECLAFSFAGNGTFTDVLGRIRSIESDAIERRGGVNVDSLERLPIEVTHALMPELNRKSSDSSVK